MEYSLDRPLLIKYLNNTDPAISLEQQLEQFPEGVKYLYLSVVCPIISGYDVNTGSLDMDKFDLDDLTELERFISLTGERNQTILYDIYSKLKQAVPVLSAVDFL
ncbi:hypothetical protein [Massiliimalia massiliensis]|uniref:hypothetical protein n=1 Tax=Massiliimalia massiliensis TaxID=1852384 RepID=UPI00117BB11F|nr:hypothetical protein [Massiliimalia massiliensis]